MIKEVKGKYRVRVEGALTVSTREDAERFERLAKAALERARREYGMGISACPTMRALIPEFIREQRTTRGNTEGTLKSYERRLLRFAVDLSQGAGDVAIDCVPAADLRHWIDGRLEAKGNKGKYQESKTISREVVNNDLKLLANFSRWCARREYCRLGDMSVLSVPLLRLKGRAHRGRNKPRGLDPGDFMELLRKLREGGRYVHLEIVLRGMVLFGARPKALFLLTWGDVTMPTRRWAGKVALPGLKEGIVADVPVEWGSKKHELLSQSRARLQLWHGVRCSKRRPVFCTLRGRAGVKAAMRYGWTAAVYGKVLARAVECCGWGTGGRRFTAYMARHSAVTWLARMGLPAVVIQHYAKHLRVSTQDVYRWTSGEEAAPAYEAVEAIMGGKAGPVLRVPDEGWVKEQFAIDEMIKEITASVQ